MVQKNKKPFNSGKSIPKNDEKRFNKELKEEITEAKGNPVKKVHSSGEIQVIYPVKPPKIKYSNNNTQNVDQSPDRDNS